MAKRATSLVRIGVAARRADAIELRMAGVDALTIGKKLAADPTVNLDGIEYPFGYGSERYEGKRPPPTDQDFTALVADDLRRVLVERRAAMETSIDDLRTLEMQRLDRMLATMWRSALGGDHHAVDRVLKIMERRAKLVGLDLAATRLVGADGGPVEVTIDALEDRITELVGQDSE